MLLDDRCLHRTSLCVARLSAGYGCLSIGYYFLTMCFALLNRRHVERLRKADFDDVENVWNPPVVVNVVGYREDPDYFRRCLSSANRLTYSNLRVIVVSIDGNDKDDEEMAEIAMSIFPDAIRINMLSDPFADRYTSFLRLVPEVDFTCSQARTVFVVSQPHMGKREALYSSFKVAEKVGAEYIFNTDSDTILDPMAVTEMIRMTKGRPDVGAVAGELTIFNDTNWLGKLTASRYLIAFNVERASLGYHGVVNCISGPMGMYQAAAVVQVMDGWVHQHFLGVKCSFGDDRNLTNRILALGKKVVYTHRATGRVRNVNTGESRFDFARHCCPALQGRRYFSWLTGNISLYCPWCCALSICLAGATETPLSYPRFVAQQTRCDSFLCESFLLLLCSHPELTEFLCVWTRYAQSRIRSVTVRHLVASH